MSDETTSLLRVTGAGDAALVGLLRAGEATAFERIVDAWSPAMLRLARSYVSTQASAEDVVQDTWLGVLKGLDGFEGRSSLKTWVFRILTNVAKTRSLRERRIVPLADVTVHWSDDGPTVDPSRFQGPGGEQPGHWTANGGPQPWEASAETQLLSVEILALVDGALDTLPERQRQVVRLRDVDGFTSDETCAVLGISMTNQRVLLHRGRAKIRGALEDYYRGSAGTEAS